MKAKSLSHVRLCDPMDCSQPGFSVHGIFQARVPKWVAISFPRGSSWPRDRTQASRIAGRRFTLWATREIPLNKKKDTRELICSLSVHSQMRTHVRHSEIVATFKPRGEASPETDYDGVTSWSHLSASRAVRK